MSAMAISPPFTICAPKEAYWPVTGPTTAIGVVGSPPPPLQLATITVAARAAIIPAIRFMLTSVENPTSPYIIHVNLAQGASARLPGQRARALVKPAILRNHLRRTHGAEAEAGCGEQHRIGDQIVVDRQERASEQGIVE